LMLRDKPINRFCPGATPPLTSVRERSHLRPRGV
jgi:hypothetical protein